MIPWSSLLCVAACVYIKGLPQANYGTQTMLDESFKPVTSLMEKVFYNCKMALGKPPGLRQDILSHVCICFFSTPSMTEDGGDVVSMIHLRNIGGSLSWCWTMNKILFKSRYPSLLPSGKLAMHELSSVLDRQISNCIYILPLQQLNRKFSKAKPSDVLRAQVMPELLCESCSWTCRLRSKD